MTPAESRIVYTMLFVIFAQLSGSHRRWFNNVFAVLCALSWLASWR